MGIFGKIGIGLGIAGAVAAVTVLVVKLVKGKEEEKPVAARVTEYRADDEIEKVEGWETCRPAEAM